MDMSTKETVQAVRNALSVARMTTYEIAVAHNDLAALALYAWNAQVSAAFLAPLHICEVVVRNAVSETLEAVYGARWPWSGGFEQSLPAPRLGYSQRKDLQSALSRAPTTGKIIPELKFVFWQKMFTGRNDARLWNFYLLKAFPGLNAARTISHLRKGIYDDLEHIRTLRNRIAHHEPIFKRNLADDLERIVHLVELRCKVTASWMLSNQQASALIALRP
jgi:hypothetical protein